jgi:energy-coupling factor transport system ATP-binding protein
MSRVGDDVAFGLENRGLSPTDIWPRVADALRTVGLGVPLATSTQALSGGEKQRLALAGVLALGPSLLLLDEPTANLDPDGATLVRAALRDALEATGATLLMVEHRVAEVLGLVTRVVVLAAGRGVIADGPPAEVFDRSGAELARAGVWVPGHRPTSEWGPPSGTPGGASRVGEARIRAREVAYRYPGAPRQAVCGMSAELHAGETLAITGPNGSGKSTFAMMLAGLMRPDAGTVEVPGDPVPLWRVPARRLVRCVGTVFQEPEHQFLTGTVADELALGPRRAGMPASQVRRRVDELLTRLGLEHLPAANPFTLSGGEKRRLSVATAMATSPPALILDEPTFGQDARTWAEMVALLSELRDEGRALAVVTHDREFVGALAGRAVRMVDGRAT